MKNNFYCYLLCLAQWKINSRLDIVFRNVNLSCLKSPMDLIVRNHRRRTSSSKFYSIY